MFLDPCLIVKTERQRENTPICNIEKSAALPQRERERERETRRNLEIEREREIIFVRASLNTHTHTQSLNTWDGATPMPRWVGGWATQER